MTEIISGYRKITLNVDFSPILDTKTVKLTSRENLAIPNTIRKVLIFDQFCLGTKI